jgi:hypothetical protein
MPRLLGFRTNQTLPNNFVAAGPFRPFPFSTIDNDTFFNEILHCRFQGVDGEPELIHTLALCHIQISFLL